MSLDNLYSLPAAEQQIILNGPALQPPDGVLPNFDNPPNRNALGIGITTLCLSIWTIAFLLRAYAKIFCMRKVEIEDYIAFAGFGLSIGFAYCAYSVAKIGYFVHQWNVRVKDLTIIFYPVHVGSELYCVILMLYKAAILLEWIRIFVPRPSRTYFYWAAYTLLWVNILFYASVIIAGNVSCTPFAKQWDKTLPGTCRGRESVDVSTASFNLASDLLIMGLAQSVIWRLKIPTKKKLGVAFVFAVGIAACIAAGFRLDASVKFVHLADATYGVCNVAVWASVEIMCATLIFCIPAMPKIFRDSPATKIATKLKTWSHYDSSRTKNSGSTAWTDTDSKTPVTHNAYQVVNDNDASVRQPYPVQGQVWYPIEHPQAYSHYQAPPAAIVRTTDFTIEERGYQRPPVETQQFHVPWNQHHQV
ncbi:uncharacterized protein F4822DRAFT_39584 [Hypoxylon trugodes]|uniref:uncharacterized protein n=1 Tax=Hypoxylon trugodes TaxID=326681 RepID=UPI0021916CAF|nr:uncharacterized protein F4822DRAFT_39584 [Hypoxylon trugodes]KAI1394175.1 hypothetical protein F4822DRAFT_39584 [Hypoxylon trugodes]